MRVIEGVGDSDLLVLNDRFNEKLRINAIIFLRTISKLGFLYNSHHVSASFSHLLP